MMLLLFLLSSELKCGPALKQKALYPEKLAEISTQAAANLEGHAKWVSAGKSKEARAEAEALRRLARDHREVAAALKKLQADLEKAETLAPAPHDLETIDPNLVKGFSYQSELERALAPLLLIDAASIDQMLAQLPKKK
jgi:hypothetical protein